MVLYWVAVRGFGRAGVVVLEESACEIGVHNGVRGLGRGYVRDKLRVAGLLMYCCGIVV